MHASRFVINNDRTELFIKGEYEPYPGGMGKFFFDGMKKLAANEELIAQIDATTNVYQSYKELFERSVMLAQYLRDIDIKPGDKIAMCSYNHLNAAVVLTATSFIGAILTPTDPILTQMDIKYLLEIVQPKLMFVADGCEEYIAGIGLPCKLIAFANNTKHESFEEIMNSTKYSAGFVPYFADNLDETTVILFSSGTTGMPKGIELSHNYCYTYLECITSRSTSESNMVFLNYASFYWITSFMLVPISLHFRSARLLCKQFDRNHHWTMIEKYKVNAMFLSNTYAMEAITTLHETMKLPQLGKIIIVGGCVNEFTLQEYRRKLPHIIVGTAYGLTECGLVTICANDDKPNSCGTPVFSNQTFKIVDPETEEVLPLNQLGEIRIKRSHQMTGYYNKDSSAAWDSQGFLKTGDLGYVDDECYVYVVDRIKEMFKYRSWHVVPTKIEAVLTNMPEILHAVVIGVPTYKEDENNAMAVVCLTTGAKADAKEIERCANEQLGEIDKIRAGVHIVDEKDFIFTSTAKINRHKMTKKFAHYGCNL